MKYSSGETPKAGDSVLGEIAGEKVSGQVTGLKKDRIIVTRRGAAKLIQLFGHVEFTKGDIEQLDGQAEDFELLYRKTSVKEAA